jgi:hypothetical protein
VNICKNHPYWNLGVNRSSRDHFFRIPHTKIEFLAIFQLKRTYFDKNFGTHRSMTPKMTKNDPKKIFSPKVPNHIKLSVEVRNDVYNGFGVFLEKKLFYFFGNLNDHFRACFGPNVKNGTDTVRTSYHIGNFSFISMPSTIFMQKIRGVTHVSRNFYEFQKLSFLPYWAKIHHFPLGARSNFI